MISIVILNWNSGGYFQEALESIVAQDSSEYELIVVDNGSSNESLKTIAAFEARGDIDIVIRLATNVGFAEGMNRGIARASGNIIVALNSDASLAPNFVRAVADAARAPTGARKVGMFAVPIYDWEFGDGVSRRTDRIQAMGMSLVRRMTVCTWDPTVDSPSSLIGPSGAAVILTREAVDASMAFSGYVYDPEYFAYAEDMDLFMRLFALGFTVEVADGTRVWHVGSASSGQQVALNRKVMFLRSLAHANKWRTWKKLGGMGTRAALLPWVIADDVLRIAVGPNRWALLRAYLRNYRSVSRWPSHRYPAAHYPFAGSLYSRSTPRATRQGLPLPFRTRSAPVADVRKTT